MKFITDIIRKDICEIINDNVFLTFAASKIFSGENKNINTELLLVDFYNHLMIKKNMNTLDSNDLKYLDLFNNKKVEELRYLIYNREFLVEAFTALVNFNSLAILDKYQINCMTFQEKDDNDLTSRMLYNLNYISSKLTNSGELSKYYNEYNHNSARDIVLNCLSEIRQNDFEGYKKVITKSISTYYIWAKYIISTKSSKLDSQSKRFIRRIKWASLNTLVDLTIYDIDFLEHLITQYLYFEYLPKDITKGVDEYAEKKLSKRMKKKFENIEENKTTRN